MPLSRAFLHFLLTILPQMQPNSHILWELCFISAFPVSFINRNQLSVVGTALLWPGLHLRLADGAPSAAHGAFSNSMPQGMAAPASGTPHRGSSHPIPSQEGTGTDHSSSSPRPLGVPIRTQLMAGPPASARPGGFSLARSNDKGPLVKAGFALSYVSTAFSLFTEYSDM